MKAMSMVNGKFVFGMAENERQKQDFKLTLKMAAAQVLKEIYDAKKSKKFYKLKKHYDT